MSKLIKGRAARTGGKENSRFLSGGRDPMMADVRDLSNSRASENESSENPRRKYFNFKPMKSPGSNPPRM